MDFGRKMLEFRAKHHLTQKQLADIIGVDLDIRPFDWDVNGKSGRTAYLQAIRVIQDVDRFAERFASEEYPED